MKMKYTIFSLGNPGVEYKNTRHNAARIVCDAIDWSNVDAEYVVPDTFMNETGNFIKKYLKQKSAVVPVIAYDDKDIAIGQIKISYDKNAGGHNGVQSVIDQLGTKEFIRIRIGIGAKTNPDMLLQDYVLSKLKSEEIEILKNLKTKMSDIINTIVKDGYAKAMDKFN